MAEKIKKMTKRDYFTQLLEVEAVQENENLLAFINHELELLERKHSKKSEKSESLQAENNELKEIIYRSMEIGKVYSVTEMQKTFPELGEYTNQKISYVVRNMVKTGDIVRQEIKGRAFFVKEN